MIKNILYAIFFNFFLKCTHFTVYNDIVKKLELQKVSSYYIFCSHGLIEMPSEIWKAGYAHSAEQLTGAIFQLLPCVSGKELLERLGQLSKTTVSSRGSSKMP